MFGWFKKKDLNAVVHARKKVIVCGVEFIIKKLDVLNHMEGANVLQKSFDTYQVPKPGQGNDNQPVNVKKLKEHYTDVICCGVVSPKIGRKDGDGVVSINDLLGNWDLAIGLYTEIIEFSYGKKKTKLRS